MRLVRFPLLKVSALAAFLIAPAYGCATGEELDDEAVVGLVGPSGPLAGSGGSGASAAMNTGASAATPGGGNNFGGLNQGASGGVPAGGGDSGGMGGDEGMAGSPTGGMSNGGSMNTGGCDWSGVDPGIDCLGSSQYFIDSCTALVECAQDNPDCITAADPFCAARSDADTKACTSTAEMASWNTTEGRPNDDSEQNPSAKAQEIVNNACGF